MELILVAIRKEDKKNNLAHVTYILKLALINEILVVPDVAWKIL